MSGELAAEWHVTRVTVREGGEVSEGVRVVRVMMDGKVVIS